MSTKNTIRSSQVDIREVYDLIHKAKEEILVEVKSLRTDFMTMEAGRLSKLEKEFAEMKGADKVRVSMVAGIVSVLITAFLFLIGKIWK